MTESIFRRISTIKRLVKIYYDLPYGQLIDKHSELLRVFDIRGSIHVFHPHKMMRVYISRRALKHFVESRKIELDKYHSPEETLKSFYFAIDSIRETITNFDDYEIRLSKYFYTKDYSIVDRPQIRIILEINNDNLEIISIHFKKKGK